MALCKQLLLGGLLCSTAMMLGVSWASAQSGWGKEGGEYPLTLRMGGDQVWPDVALTANGGYVAWQGNHIDGQGLGIGAQRLGENLSSEFGAFRVNEQAQGDQENPEVAALRNGGAVFVWESGPQDEEDIFARFMAADGTFLSPEIRVNEHTPGGQIDPTVATLSDGTVVVAWTSHKEDGDKEGVFGQRLTAEGEKLGAPFQVNQEVMHNQRDPAVASLPGGGFVVAWVSELATERPQDVGTSRRIEGDNVAVFHVEIFARRYGADGKPVTEETQVSRGEGEPCANPQVAAAETGFQVAWSQKALEPLSDSWDIYGRLMRSSLEPQTEPYRVNTQHYGDQYAPQVAVGANGSGLIAWTALGQDESGKAVMARAVDPSGEPVGESFRVNTTTRGNQMHPAPAILDGRAMLVWSGFVGGEGSFDLFAQRYSRQPLLPRPSKPYARAVSPTRLTITWAEIEGYKVDAYQLYLDGEEEPITVAGDRNQFELTGLRPDSEHRVALSYRLNDGAQAPLSDAIRASTWGEDANYDGIPDDWQKDHWGSNPDDWPDPRTDSDGDGAHVLNEFLAGTDPTDPESTLLTRIDSTDRGLRLVWNTAEGGIYQVQVSPDMETWSDYAEPRFAPDATDSISIPTSKEEQYFRVVRLH